VIRPGDVQRMSAGTRRTPQRVQRLTAEPVHFLQIWIEPAKPGIAPGYEQKAFTERDKRGRLRLVASPDGADGSLTIHQDARVYATRLGAGRTVEHKLAPGRHAWVQVTRGALTAGGQRLAHGDGAAISGEPVVKLGGRGGRRGVALRFTVTRLSAAVRAEKSKSQPSRPAARARRIAGDSTRRRGLAALCPARRASSRAPPARPGGAPSPTGDAIAAAHAPERTARRGLRRRRAARWCRTPSRSCAHREIRTMSFTPARESFVGIGK
jgi:hypothetical protein